MVFRDRNTTERSPTVMEGPSLTKASFKDQCDVNLILKGYSKTGLLRQVQGASFMSVPSVDFHEAMNIITEAEQGFAELPAKIRRRFNNDPAALLSFMEDDRNYDEALSLGLVEQRAEPANNESPPATAKPPAAAPDDGVPPAT